MYLCFFYPRLKAGAWEPKGFSIRLGFTITVLILALLVGAILAALGVG